MIRITVNKKKYKGIYLWSDMTLRQFKKLASVPIPEKYSSYVVADGAIDFQSKESIDKYIDEVSKITKDDLDSVFPEYYRKVAGVLTDIPEVVINSLSTDKIEELFDFYFKKFVLTLLYGTPMTFVNGKYLLYEPFYKKYFIVGWNRYYIPETVVVAGEQVPLAKEPVVSFSEATDLLRNMDLMKEEDIDKFSLFMAVYCRKNNEKYSEKKVIDRKELFMDANMNDVWSVFFYIIRRLRDYSTGIRLFTDLPQDTRGRILRVKRLKPMVTGE